MLTLVKSSPLRAILALLVLLSASLVTFSLGAGSPRQVSAAVSLPGDSSYAPNNNTAQPVPFAQDWSGTNQITVNDDWSGVPGIEGFLGDDPTTATNIDPRTVFTPYVTLDVIANQSNPNTVTAGGVAEFDGITNPVVALQGSGSADFPYVAIYLNTTGQSNIHVQYNVRDIDGSADNAVQQVNLQYRIGNSGNFANVPGGYIADATTGPSLATLVTPVDLFLPVAADNQPRVELRVMTTNAAGSDEWVGIDDINITTGPTATNTPGGPTATETAVPPTATASATPAPPALIRQIQAAQHRSPLEGQAVSNVTGIVTGVAPNGFYMQDPAPDADDATSEGIFVFTSSPPTTVSVGHAVSVSGTVVEFRAGGASSGNLTLTEISSPVVVVQSTGNTLPTPVVIGTGGRIPPNTIIEDDATGNVETSGVFDVTQDGIDFYESMEGMRVQVNNPVAVGPRNNFGEIAVLGDDGANGGVRTTRGGIIIQPNDFNPERIILDDVITTTPPVNVGDHFGGPAIGVMDYNFGNFKLQITQALAGVSSGLTREVAATPGPNQLVIGNFNVENLDPNDPDLQFSTLAGLIVNNMRSPDIISIEEIQDNDGPTNSTVVDATNTWNELIAAIVAAGGPTYQFRNVNPVDDQDGGEPGGNIRQGFLFRTDRGVAFIDRPGGCSTCANSVVSGAGGPELAYSPGRIDPTNSAFNSSRKPLTGEFTYNGHKLFLIGNHLNSKGGDHPLFGRFQPPVRSSEVQRHQQAQIINNFVDSILAVDANANVVVLGDLNDFWFSTTINIIEGDVPTGAPGGAGVLQNLMETLPLTERYSYVFDGNSQDLDNTIVSNNLLASLAQFDPLHVNSEFADQASDHDPQVSFYNLPSGATATPTVPGTSTTTSTSTNTPLPPSSTSTTTSTNTQVPPTSTTTSTQVPPTSTTTRTNTAVTTATNTVLATATPSCVPGQSLLLIPDSTNDRVMAFDALTGNLVNANFIPSDPTNLAIPRNAILSADGQFVLVSDQTRDVVQKYTLTGAYVGVFAPAGGPNTSILDNIRGITLRPNGNLLVTVGGGANTNSVAEFDTAGAYIGNFVTAGSGGLASPFDVYSRTNDYLVSGFTSDAVHRYSSTGAYLGNLNTSPINVPEQISEASNGNVLVISFNPDATDGVYEYTAGGTFVGRYDPPSMTTYSGVYELPNGNLLVTNGTGVHEITRANVLVSTKISGVTAQYIERVTLPPSGNCPTSTATSTSATTATATRTSTSTATRTATNTIVVPSSTTTRTNTAIASVTNTVAASATNTSIASATRTNTAVASATRTNTAVSSATRTNTAVPPTSTSTVIPSATATVCVMPFTDVDIYNPFYVYIKCLYCRGIISGYADNTFRPYNDTTRGQMSKIVSNAAGFTDPVSGQTYTDVPPSHPFYVWIERLTMHGVVSGYNTGCTTGVPCFKPENTVTRGQMAKITSNAAGFSDVPPAGTLTFTDVPPSNPFYIWIERLSRRGIVTGYECGVDPGEPCDGGNRPYYRPFNNVTRGQASKIVANTFFPVDCTPGIPPVLPGR